EYMRDLFSSYDLNNGSIILFTCEEVPDNFEAFMFDKIIKIGEPDYKESVTTLFGKVLQQSQLDNLAKLFAVNKLSYAYMHKIYKLFIKSKLKKSSKKKDNPYTDICQIVTGLMKEDDKIIKTQTKKVGISKNKGE